MVLLFFAFFTLLFGQAMPQPIAWSAMVDPSTANASGVHWTLLLSAHYCGGYNLGDGVHIEPEAPIALPVPVPSDSVLLDGLAAVPSADNGVLSVLPAPDRLWSQVCLQGERPLTIDLLPDMGMTNPSAGTYAVDVWIDSGPHVQLPVTFDDPQ
jgi:hypothetical protein